MYIRYFFFFFKQKTAYEMRMSDWSSDVCSSDLRTVLRQAQHERVGFRSVDSESSHPARQVAARCVADLAAAIAVQYRAGDIARGGRTEEHRRFGDFLDLAPPLHRDPVVMRLPRFRIGGEALHPFGIGDRAGRYAVHPQDRKRTHLNSSHSC